jgi:hypothetical protein
MKHPHDSPSIYFDSPYSCLTAAKVRADFEDAAGAAGAEIEPA